jgi:hypothetical protein
LLPFASATSTSCVDYLTPESPADVPVASLTEDHILLPFASVASTSCADYLTPESPADVLVASLTEDHILLPLASATSTSCADLSLMITDHCYTSARFCYKHFMCRPFLDDHGSLIE